MDNDTSLQQGDLLAGARNAFLYLQANYKEFSFRVAFKNAGSCGKGWFTSPDSLNILNIIFVVGNDTYMISSTNPEWTKFSVPRLVGPGQWLGVNPYNPFDVNFGGSQAFSLLRNYLAGKGYHQPLYTQVALVQEDYPPYDLVYGYDLDLSKYGFNVTQYVTVAQNGHVGQADEIGFCPLPGE